MLDMRFRLERDKTLADNKNQLGRDRATAKI
jgi:hypothetical protein